MAFSNGLSNKLPFPYSCHFGVDVILERSLDLDHEKETVDGENLFHSDDDEIDKEEYEGYTGNAGPEVQYWYHKACLVIWPRAFAVKIALSAGLESAVNLGRRSLNYATEDEHAESARGAIQ